MEVLSAGHSAGDKVNRQRVLAAAPLSLQYMPGRAAALRGAKIWRLPVSPQHDGSAAFHLGTSGCASTGARLLFSPPASTQPGHAWHPCRRPLPPFRASRAGAGDRPGTRAACAAGSPPPLAKRGRARCGRVGPPLRHWQPLGLRSYPDAGGAGVVLFAGLPDSAECGSLSGERVLSLGLARALKKGQNGKKDVALA